ncbi:Smx4 component of heteroheptameric complexes (Lsm1p, Lsm8p) [Candida orthopsilosis Co 90-125]|uniref:LSM complex subunit LSM3 n=1 Tax=Candida orthopsilosis (strain 90-125) TaxID=1136231 RepID=H8XAM0_CANO9|nr:Smx4 component of heteroheptameric complexes (Lsm1p, Lsm8p) [Candida orthopsilosis Co 90-125]CCG24870.1 Smx4 component of heteroheptameric complexes (Lsm1p, Lsm8p) [Candida orthopsilosis Co 90-125]
MSSVQTEHKQQQEPLDLIRFQLDEYVIVKLRGAREFKGKLQGYDSHCNLVLSDATETIFSDKDGVDPIIKRTEMVFVRGDSVILISPVIEK